MIKYLGLWSATREALLGHPSPPYETGDLAFRATLPRKEILELNDPRASELLTRKVVTVWFGPDKHCVMYPINGGKNYNLVLAGPDDMPSGSRTAEATLEEMIKSFEGWDDL